jgi:hypothetical protein
MQIVVVLPGAGSMQRTTSSGHCASQPPITATSLLLQALLSAGKWGESNQGIKEMFILSQTSNDENDKQKNTRKKFHLVSVRVF